MGGGGGNNGQKLADVIFLIAFSVQGMDWKRETFDMALWIKTLHQMNINSLFTLTKGLNPLKPNVVALKVSQSGNI